jgi:hypothetical protein
MTRREHQAFNDGKLAFADGKPMSSCSRRSPEQRAAWRAGYEEERRQATAAKATPEELSTARDRVRQLSAWAQTL